MKAKNLQLISAIIESILAVPIVGGIFILSLIWMPLLVALTFHILTIVFANNEKKKIPISGNIIGIIASILGVIPIIGWILHLTAAIVLWTNYNKN